MMILLKRDKITTKYENFLYIANIQNFFIFCCNIIGDLNYDFFDEKNVHHW